MPTFFVMSFKANVVTDPTQPKPLNSIRVICLADTHGFHDSIPSEELYPADLLLFAGDFSMLGNPIEVESFKSWLHSLKIPSVVIAGNADTPFDLAQLPRFKNWIEERIHPGVPVETIKPTFLSDLQNIVYLEDSEVTIFGVKIWGSPYTLWHGDSGFRIQNYQASAKWRKIPKDADVLVVHSPPKYCRDRSVKGDHGGCSELRRVIEKLKPALVVFGHIHEGYGVSMIGETVCVNASIVDYRRTPINAPILVDLVRK
jgi:Icc-related predicted phosphoesterase